MQAILTSPLNQVLNHLLGITRESEELDLVILQEVGEAFRCGQVNLVPSLIQAIAKSNKRLNISPGSICQK